MYSEKFLINKIFDQQNENWRLYKRIKRLEKRKVVLISEFIKDLIFFRANSLLMQIIKHKLSGGGFTKRIEEGYLSSKNIKRRLCFATSIDDNFTKGLATLLVSIQKHNPNFNFDFIVFNQGLSNESKKSLQDVYPRIKFKNIDEKKYQTVKCKENNRLSETKTGRHINNHSRLSKAAYFAIETFSLYEYDTAIYLDSDMVCRGSIDGILKEKAGFASCLNLGIKIEPQKQIKSNNFIFNTGLFIINKSYLNEKTYNEILDLANSDFKCIDPYLEKFCDQRVLNHYFKDKKVKVLSSSFNCLKRLYFSYPFFDINKVTFLHYVGAKPWIEYDNINQELEKNHFKDINNIWWDYYKDIYKYVRLKEFETSGEKGKIENLKDIHKTKKRCFILGNGPSLNEQNLDFLKDEVCFASNWFAVSDLYKKIKPQYYLICSHTVFGGWDTYKPEIEPNFQKMINEHVGDSTIFTSFKFKNYIESEDIFPNKKLNYLLFEKPFKEFVYKKGDVNIDPTLFVDDAQTVVSTFGIILAMHMGFEEIYLLGCDCSYEKDKSSKNNYFYDVKLHTTKTTNRDSLINTWEPGGSGYQCYEIIKQKANKAGFKIFNAGYKGNLEVFPRVDLETLK